MEHNSDQADRLLRQPSSHLSDHSLNSNSTLITSPTSPPLHRHGHSRENSATEEDTSGHGADVSQQSGYGLGITNVNEQGRASITRKPVEGRTSSTKSLSTELLLSPVSAARQREIRFDDEHEENVHNDSDVPSHQPFTANSDREPLDKRPSLIQADFECRMKSRPASGRSSWLAVSILVLAIYSTLFSGIWLIIAMMKLPYGHTVSRRGVPFTTASILYTAFAKSIELSFVTVFVAFIGQVLSKRALLQTRGVTMAEMTMRSWVMQPGTIISHWESVKYGLASTKLSIFALLVALMAMTYTTASDALVTPVLQFSKTESRLMFGRVSTSFANTYTISNNCKTPIPEKIDPNNSAVTCIQIQHSAQAYHNYMQYLTTWTDNINSGNGSDELTQRPDPVGMFYDNTTLKGSWIDVQNSSDLSEQYGRNVNNITMAMPHIGVITAATDPINGIIQPSDLNGLGEYTVQASVPSPVINVLCAGMNIDEMAPMVYTKWTSFNGTLPNGTNWPNEFDLATPSSVLPTAVDDLFGFDDIQKHPIFPILPESYNTVFNYSTIWGQDSVFVLATSATGTYTMCSMRVALSPNCSTEYSASVSGGSLTSHCDPGNPLAYIRSEPKAPQGVWSQDWVNVVSEWGNGLSLNAGIVNGNGANARLLSQLIPTSTSLDPSLPSISEALAVLAGGTLILSSQGSPFIHWWNYSTTDTLVDPQYQAFNATLKTREYMSGGQHPWQGVFYIVLLVVFVTNVICLGYFVISGSHLTDFMEPQNMFPLSLNSPPSAVVDGSCGGSLTKEQFGAIWRIVHDSEREHLYIESKDGMPKKARKRGYSRQTEFEMKSPMEIMYSELGRKRTSRL